MKDEKKYDAVEAEGQKEKKEESDHYSDDNDHIKDDVDTLKKSSRILSAAKPPQIEAAGDDNDEEGGYTSVEDGDDLDPIAQEAEKQFQESMKSGRLSESTKGSKVGKVPTSDKGSDAGQVDENDVPIEADNVSPRKSDKI